VAFIEAEAFSCSCAVESPPARVTGVENDQLGNVGRHESRLEALEKLKEYV
jgi:hypothetical protein